jgi:hypothetical protein
MGCCLVLWGCSAPTEPQPPSGGEDYVLDFDTFVSQVAPVLSRQGCDAQGNCHGGGIRGTFALSPAGAKNLGYDFDQAALQVNGYDPAQSPLLTKPLAGDPPHPVEPFASATDPDYQTILTWIQSGRFAE